MSTTTVLNPDADLASVARTLATLGIRALDHDHHPTPIETRRYALDVALDAAGWVLGDPDELRQAVTNAVRVAGPRFADVEAELLGVLVGKAADRLLPVARQLVSARHTVNRYRRQPVDDVVLVDAQAHDNGTRWTVAAALNLSPLDLDTAVNVVLDHVDSLDDVDVEPLAIRLTPYLVTRRIDSIPEEA